MRAFFSLSMSSAHSPTFTVALPTSQLILQPFFRFTYVTSSSLNSPGEPAMKYYNESINLCVLFLPFTPTFTVASPTSQLILQPFFRFSYVTSSFNSPGEAPLKYYRVIQIIREHTDGCRSRPWLPRCPVSGPS